jgi:hypothetical protein
MKSLLIIYFCITGDPKCFSTDTYSEIHTNIASCSQADDVIRNIRKGDAKLFGQYPILIIKYKCTEGV